MKKIMGMILIVMVTLFSLAGCGGDDGSGNAGDGGNGSPSGGGSGKKTFIIAHSMAEDTCFKALTDAMEEVLTESGYFDVQIYPAAQLGSENDGIQATQLGNITMYPTYTGSYSVFAPPCYVFDRMFSFSTVEEARAVYADEQFLAVFNREMEEYGFKNLGFADMGLRRTTTKDYVESVADFKGMIIRTIENPIHMAAWRNIGANPTPVAFTELYSALQQGVAKAQENTVEVTYSTKVYEQQNYIIDTNHLFHGILMAMNLDYYNNLTPEEQAAVDLAGETAIKAVQEFTDDAVTRYLEVFAQAGCEEIFLTDEVRNELRDLAVDSWDMVKDQVSSELYDAYVDAIERAEAAKNR